MFVRVIAALQRMNTMTFLKKSGNPIAAAGQFASELSESSLDFMKKQSKFVHDIVR
jgi:hypothetical protein